jgi:hypothetical protein
MLSLITEFFAMGSSRSGKWIVYGGYFLFNKWSPGCLYTIATIR